MLFARSVRLPSTSLSSCFSLMTSIEYFDSLLRIPLSAFIVEDMMEFVHAHASYRFVIQDEEEEKPRILVSGWSSCQRDISNRP